MGEKVSVIIPVYNSEQYVKKTIDSVLKQREDGIEIETILIDDCSSDGSYRILEQYSHRDSVKVYRTEKPSGSASKPRNIGLDNSTGEYVLFVDSDDALKPHALSQMLRCVEEHGVDLFDFAYEDVFSSKNRTINKRYLEQGEGEYYSNECIEDWFSICHPIFTKLFKRSTIETNGIRFIETLRNGEDSMFLFEYFNCIDRFWHQNNVVYEYYHRDNSVSHTYDVKYHKSFFDTYSAMESWANTEKKKKYYEQFLAYTLFPNLEILCDSSFIDESDLVSLLDEYYRKIQESIDCVHGGANSAFKTILYKDIFEKRRDYFTSDFYALRTIFTQRKDLIEEITKSRGWKLISRINHFIGRA